MMIKLVRMGVTAAGVAGVAVLALAGTTAAAGAETSAKAGGALVARAAGTVVRPAQAAPAYEAEMSDAEIERYLAEFPLIEVDPSEVTPVDEGLGVTLDVDPDTGCLTREAAASITMPEGAEEAAIRISDLEMPNCWDLVNYLRRHPVG